MPTWFTNSSSTLGRMAITNDVVVTSTGQMPLTIFFLRLRKIFWTPSPYVHYALESRIINKLFLLFICNYSQQKNVRIVVCLSVCPRSLTWFPSLTTQSTPFTWLLLWPSTFNSPSVLPQIPFHVRTSLWPHSTLPLTGAHLMKIQQMPQEEDGYTTKY